MTYAADLVAANAHRLGFTLAIDGLPVLFGTRAGMVYPDPAGVDNAPTPWTSVGAIVRGSVSVDGEKLNYDTLMVPPGSASMRLRTSPEWDGVLRRRDEPTFVVSTLLTESATTVVLNTTSGITAGDVLYVNRETLLVGSVDSGTSLTVTRNYCALHACNRGGQTHIVGAVVSKCPRYLLGRMCEMRAWIGEGNDSTSVLRVLYLAGSPRYNLAANAWELEFSDAMRVFDRKIATGIVGSQCQVFASTVLVDSAPTFDISIPTPREFVNMGHDNGSVALYDQSGNAAFERIIAWNGSAPTIRGSNMYSALGDAANITTVRRIYEFQGAPMRMALQLLLSDRGLGAGSGTNSATWDVLLGYTTTSNASTRRLGVGEIEMRYGAAAPANLVDVATLETFIHDVVPGFYYVVGLREESLLTILEEVAWHLKGFWHFNALGQLSFARFAAHAPGAAVAGVVDTSTWLRGSSLVSVDDESEVVHTVSMKVNRDPVKDQYFGSLTSIYEQERETYRETSAKLEVSRPSLYVDLPGQSIADVLAQGQRVSPVSSDIVRVSLDRVQATRCNGIRKYSLHLPWRFSTLKPGDRLTVTSDKHQAFDGTTLAAATLEVSSISIDPRPRTKAPVAVELREVAASVRIGPTSKISSATSATLTLATSSKWDAGTPATKPGRWWAAGWKVLILDASTSPPYSTSEAAIVSSVTDTTVVLTAPPSMIVAAGDLLVLDTYGNADSTTPDDALGIAQRSFAFGASTNFLLDGGTAAQKWG